MKLKTLVLLGGILALGFMSCSDDKDEVLVDGGEVQKMTPINLSASKLKIEPFERLKLEIGIPEDEVWNSYDSITWRCNGFAYPWMSNPWHNEEGRFDRSVTDYRLGKNQVKVYGYKDGILISRDSIVYEVSTPTKDFYRINWGEGDNSNNYTYTSAPLERVTGKKTYIQLRLSHSVDEKKPEHAIFSFTPISSSLRMSGGEKMAFTARNENNINLELPEIDTYDFIAALDNKGTEEKLVEAVELTRSFWHSYVTMMYGESLFKYEGEDVRETNLWDDYNKRFRNKLTDITPNGYTDVYPVEIWETPTTYICLYTVYRGWYYVVAEPRY